MISLLRSVLADFAAFFSPYSRNGRIRAVIVLGIITAAVIFFPKSDTPSADTTATLPLVSTLEVGEYNNTASLTLLGEVSAASEVDLLAQTSGQVTSVPVSLGSYVRSGEVIARLDGASEYAALLQAEGAYEAAVAAAAQSEVTVTGAEKNLDLTYDNTRRTLEGVISTLQSTFYNDLDEIFADPERTYRTPGFISEEDAPRLQLLNTTYKRLLDTIDTLEVPNTNDDLNVTGVAQISKAVQDLKTSVATLRTMIADDSYQGTQSTTANQYLSTLSSVANTLTAQENAVAQALRSVESAKEALAQAELGGTTTTASASSARVKQALGALRAAQAAYNKTIIRTPIDGTVAALPVTFGNYMSQSGLVATISNESASEIIVYVNETERKGLAVGDDVILENGGRGTIASIAPSISPDTGKIEVRINSSDDQLLSGDTTRVTFDLQDDPDSVDSAFSIPLTAIKFIGDTAAVFTISPENTLVAQEVVLGRPHGSDITVTSGLRADMEILADARGHVTGELVSRK